MPVPFCRIHRKKILIIDGIVAILCGLGAYQLILKPSTGAILDETPDGLTIVWERVETGFHAGDRIMRVSKHPIHFAEELEQILDKYAVGETVTIDVLRNGSQKCVAITLVTHHSMQAWILVVISGAIFLFLGIYVFVKRPDDIAAYLFHLTSISAAIIILCSWGRYTVLPIVVGIAPRLIYFIAYAFLGTLFIHFTFLFPREKFPRRKKLLVVLYTLSTCLFLSQLITQAIFLITDSTSALHLFIFPSHRGSRLLLNVGLVFAIGNFIHSALTAKEESERRKLRLVMAGMSGVLVFVLLYLFPLLIGDPPIITEEWSTVLATTAPISFAISFVAFNLMNIDVFIRRSTVYFIGFVGLALLFAGLDWIVITLFGRPGYGGLILVSVISIGIYMFLLESKRGVIQMFVNKKFFRIPYDFRATQKSFAETIKQMYDLETLGKTVVSMIDSVIPVDRIGLFLIGPSGLRLHVMAHKGYDVLERFGVEFHFDELRIDMRKPVALKHLVEPPAVFIQGDESVFTRWRMAIVFAMLGERGQATGFLVLGKKKSGQRFSLEDVDLLATAALQTGLAVESIQLHEKLVVARSESQHLQELSDLKSYFVSSVSHELKTPLTSIRMFAEMLDQKLPATSDDMRKYLRVIVGESDRLSRLISDVLDYARIERGEMLYQRRPHDLQSILDSVLSVMEYQLLMKKFNVTTTFEAKNVTLCVDHDAVKQAVINLLSNAMKYAGEKKIVDLRTGITDHVAYIAVRDFGCGIRKEDVARLSTPFFRLNEHKNIAGAGLGLSIVRHIMKAHEGRLHIESTSGEGSTFTLHFPLDESVVHA